MPKIVDHDERRAEIIEATWRVIARDGMAHTTTRQIAREAGCSFGVLAHYFTGKEALLASALVASHANVRGRTDALNRGRSGLPALRTLMLESLPLDDGRVVEAKVEVSFWGFAIGNPELIEIQNAEVDGLWERIHRRLREAEAQGQLRSGVDVDLVAHSCLALIDSLSLRATMYPERTTTETQVRMLDTLLGLISAPGQDPAGRVPAGPEGPARR
jgi:AcrR family transcriptional regulator